MDTVIIRSESSTRLNVLGYIARANDFSDDEFIGKYYSEDPEVTEEDYNGNKWTDDITKARIFKEKTDAFEVKFTNYSFSGIEYQYDCSVDWLPIIENQS